MIITRKCLQCATERLIVIGRRRAIANWYIINGLHIHNTHAHSDARCYPARHRLCHVRYVCACVSGGVRRYAIVHAHTTRSRFGECVRRTHQPFGHLLRGWTLQQRRAHNFVASDQTRKSGDAEHNNNYINIHV